MTSGPKDTEPDPTLLDHTERKDSKETAPTIQMTQSTTLAEPRRPRKPSLESFGDYEVEGELGRGGMGIVYLARQTKLNRRVALKMLTGHYGPDELQRFVEEAETAGGLNHTNILHIYEVGEHEGAPYFSMEFVEGGSLADRLRKGLPSHQETAELMISIARALHYAHKHGIVHRDMKPANVLLDAGGVPKIADFGIAKRLHDDSQLTRTGSIIGTPTYMAPEQARGNSRHVGPPADVYSLGAILYEMLTGRPPFLPEDSEAPLTVRVLTEEPVSPAFHDSSIPRDLEVICMKCLEKEPKNRYHSADALAEDLRRFLDDESILAKPPNKIVNTIKWVRRHPWKFVGIGSALVVLIATIASLAYWDLYRRAQLEYATSVDWTNGGIEALENVGRNNAEKSVSYLRLTRRGRLGPVVNVEVLNSRGYPAVQRRTLMDERIPLYIEGLAKAQPFGEKLPETTRVEFVLAGNVVSEAIGRDRNSQVNWRIIYDLAGSNSSVARARFVNLRGFNAASRNGASHMEIERDALGRDSKISFFDATGKPAANGEGVFGYLIERDQIGRISKLTNLGAEKQPVPNRAGLVAFAIKRDNTKRVEYLDANGQPTTWNGKAAEVTENDSAGNPIRISQLRADGQLVNDDANEWSVQEMKRNDHGELTQRVFYKADQSGALKQISKLDVSYDNFGHPADMKFDGIVPWHSAMQYDQAGNVTEEKNLGASGEPVPGSMGFAIKRISYTSTENGLRIEQTYFDASGNKTYGTGGYHRLVDEFDVTGAFKRQSMEEHDPSKFKYYRYVTEPEYDAQGRTRHITSRFEDAQGQLATSADLAYSAEEFIYDEGGRVTTEWKIGTDPVYFGGTSVRIDTKYQANGKMEFRIRQVCDNNRQPVLISENGNAARFEETFDFVGQRSAINESGFNEKLVGFSRRTTIFTGGNFQGVTHTRSDGKQVGSVLVVITQIVPPENQPKSAELRPGDIFAAVNGKPITTAYAWVFGGAFPGGTVEVIRNGQRIKIEGFVAGTLGVGLEERAR